MKHQDSDSEIEEIDGDTSSFERKYKEATEKAKSKKVKPEVLNPDFENDERSLGLTTFWSMHMFLEDTTDSEFNDDSGNGYVEGILKKTIGPVKAGTNVQLTNDGDTVTIQVRDEDEEDVDWEEIYHFRVILQPPVIVEPKNKM